MCNVAILILNNIEVVGSRCNLYQVEGIISGAAIAAAAYAGRFSIQAWKAFKVRPPTARLRRFYDGGFQPSMTKREAAIILGIRYH